MSLPYESLDFSVFEILLAFLRSNDWEKAFYDVIPQRKLLPRTPSEAPGRSELSDDSESSSNAGSTMERLDDGAVPSVDWSSTGITSPSGPPDADHLPSSVEDGQEPLLAVALETGTSSTN